MIGDRLLWHGIRSQPIWRDCIYRNIAKIEVLRLSQPSFELPTEPFGMSGARTHADNDVERALRLMPDLNVLSERAQDLGSVCKSGGRAECRPIQGALRNLAAITSFTCRHVLLHHSVCVGSGIPVSMC